MSIKKAILILTILTIISVIVLIFFVKKNTKNDIENLDKSNVVIEKINIEKKEIIKATSTEDKELIEKINRVRESTMNNDGTVSPETTQKIVELINQRQESSNLNISEDEKQIESERLLDIQQRVDAINN